MFLEEALWASPLFLLLLKTTAEEAPGMPINSTSRRKGFRISPGFARFRWYMYDSLFALKFFLARSSDLVNHIKLEISKFAKPKNKHSLSRQHTKPLRTPRKVEDRRSSIRRHKSIQIKTNGIFLRSDHKKS